MEALDIYYISFSKKPKSGYKCLVAIFPENSQYLTLNSLGTTLEIFSFYLFLLGTEPARVLKPHTHCLTLLSSYSREEAHTNSHAPTRTKLLSFIHDSYFREEA